MAHCKTSYWSLPNLLQTIVLFIVVLIQYSLKFHNSVSGKVHNMKYYKMIMIIAQYAVQLLIEFIFNQILEENWLTIRDEGMAQMNESTGMFLPEEENLTEEGDWKQLTLYSRGIQAVFVPYQFYFMLTFPLNVINILQNFCWPLSF